MINLNEKPNVDKFISSLQDQELIVYEDIEGTKLYIQYNGDRFIIKTKSFKGDELNFVDLTVQKYYNKAFAFFHTLPSYITDILNKNWWFVFEYLPDEISSNIKYKKVPKNNLILTSIVKYNKHKFNYDEIVEYSNLFGVDPIPLIFKGKLTSKQLEVINLFLKTSDDDLKFIFGEDNFAKFFYNILNPSIDNSFLMEDGEYNNNLEKIIIKIDGNDKYTFEILNPMFEKNKDNNMTEHSQIYSLIIINFLEFLQLVNIEKYKPKGLTNDEMYINLICDIFNDYIFNMKEDIEKWDIIIPEFIKKDKFKININLIRNNKTREYIKSNSKIEYIFKIILGSYNKKRKKPIGIMTDNTVELLNNMVVRIKKHIDNLLNINKEYRFKKIDLLNFGEYFNLKTDKDGSGEIYTDIGVQFEDEEKTEITKGKKGKKGTIISKKK
jgi:hypothetical protein